MKYEEWTALPCTFILLPSAFILLPSAFLAVQDTRSGKTACPSCALSDHRCTLGREDFSGGPVSLRGSGGCNDHGVKQIAKMAGRENAQRPRIRGLYGFGHGHFEGVGWKQHQAASKAMLALYWPCRVLLSAKPGGTTIVGIASIDTVAYNTAHLPATPGLTAGAVSGTLQ